MKNEELALEIQRGRADLIPSLWEQVARFVYYMAGKWYRGMGSNKRGIELEDLTQEGCVAMLEAAAAFDPEAGKTFIGYLVFYLQKHFSELSYYRTLKGKGDPLNSAASLDELTEDAYSLTETIPDPAAEEAFAECEERLNAETLRSALEWALNRISEDEAAVVRSIYFDGKTAATVAREKGLKLQKVHNLKRQALEDLRKRKRLETYVDDRTSFYGNPGIAAYERSGASVVERTVMQRENMWNR